MLRQNPSSSPSSAARAAATVATSTSSSMSCWRWQLMLLGLFYIVMQCDARAVNVSNTWTMPQEGLNVFYRFFRDRISWFEADAVCQFHHANLVTVDNSFQFDATRDLLRELDVNDIVWIGLMRPQSSDRFMWSSNSRPLVADTGYWAESLPLMDAPLCAVIDPIRDYRWHALRCGGPETASFLCEMPVPSWADICILKDMPNLTMQYMADTASIELIRNCQEEGLLRTMCRGKQDRERALQDLICPRERLEAQRINDITNSHFKSLQIINSIPSDNNENNDIELLPMDVNYGSHYPEELQTEKNTVQRLIEQFNVDELMQADEPANMETVSSFYKIPGLIPKPVKKSAKKVSEYPKKDSVKKQIVMQSQTKDKNRMTLEMDDMMLGDQPQGEPEMPEQILNDDVSNEIMEPLPHIKKTNIHKEAMEKMEKEAIAMKESMQKNKEMEAKKFAAEKLSRSTTTTTTTTTSTTTTTTAEPSTSSSTTEASSTTAAPTTTTKEPETTPRHHHEDSTTELEASVAGHSSSSTTPPATIGHPMHPQQPRSSIITEATPHPHVKESADNSHFIPPMLMVKSHYVPQANKHGHNEHSVHPPNHAEHLESTTVNGDELTEATRSHTDAVMTTVKTKDFEATTLKAMDINTKHHEHELSEKIATESAGPLITEEETTENGNMIPITQRQQEPEEEKQANANTEIMNLEEETATDSNTKDTTQTPSTPKAQDTTVVPLTTVPPPIASEDSTAAPPSLLHKKEITLQTTTMKLAATETQNPTDDNVSKADDAEVAPADVETPDEADATKAILMQELKPQTDMETETTQTAKLVEETTTTKTGSAISTASEAMETTKQKHDLVTETTPPAAAVATTIAQMGEDKASQLTNIEEDEQEQHHLLVQQEAEETSQKTTATATTTTELATEAMATSGTVTILATDIQTTSGEMKSASEEHKGIASEETEYKPTDNIKEAVAETTDVTTENANETHENLESNTGSSSSTSTTTITTIKPTTETNENTTTNSNSNTNSPTTETSTTLFMPSTTSSTSTTTHPPTAIISSTTTTTAATTTTTSTTSSTPSPSSTPTPETTRNFLKVTTEMPFKPNRRRSLTKPDTVSYMKKILG